MHCSCDRDYDSVTGEMYDTVCDWCLEDDDQYEYGNQETPWATENTMIRSHLYMCSYYHTPADRILHALRPLFTYVLTIEPYIKAFPDFARVLAATVAELKTDPHATPIAELLTTVEEFLRDVAV